MLGPDGPLGDRLSPQLAARTWCLARAHRLDARTPVRLTRVLRRLRPAVVHTHLPTGLLWGAPVAAALGLPVVHTVHGVHGDDEAWVARLRPVLARACRAIVGCNAGVAADIVSRGWAGTVPVRAIDNGVPLTDRPVRVAHEAPTRLICVGRLVPIKGHTHLVDAVARLVMDGRDVTLDLLGDGPERPALAAQIARLDLEARVRLRGRVDDVPRRLAEADLFVLPSLSEAMPLAAVEAAAAGLPLVLTTGGDATALLDEGAGGVAVAPGDGAALAEAIATLLDSSAERRAALGAASRGAALAHHDIGACARAYRALYAGEPPGDTA